MAYTTSDLLADIKLRVFAPSGSTRTFQDTDYLLLADAAMQSIILPMLQSQREEYLVTYKDLAVTADQAAYDIPVRAVGMQLRDVWLVDTDGTLIDLPELNPELRATTLSGDPRAFFLRMNQVHLYPTPSATLRTLRLEYFLRPGKLVETSAAAQISAIDTLTGIVTVGSVPSTWSTTDEYDLVRKDGGGEPRAVDQTVSAVTTTTLTLASLPTGLATSDYVSLAGESPIPQVPAELRPVLAQAVAVKVCEAMKLPALEDSRKTLEMEIKAAQLLLTPRVLGAAKKVVPPRRGAI